ncbi:MAG: PKD domain-containing protein [Flavobacteriales bacterium]|nr:PKD domain-containing protein [Flavobacteriales bacterium]
MQGCDDTFSHDIHVFDPPAVQIASQNVCEGVTGQFFDQTVTAVGNEVIQWSWDFGDGDTSDLEDPTHLYLASGGYTVTLTVNTPYCSGTGIQNVLVEAKPVASFVPVPNIGCSPLDVSFTNTSTGAVSYVWDFGDGTSDTNPSPQHTYFNAGPGNAIDTVMLVASTLFGCSDTATAMITVAPPVVAGFTHNALPGCAPLDVQLALVFPVTMIGANAFGCVDTTYDQVTVYPVPSASFNVAPGIGCHPLTAQMMNASTGATIYDWSYGDGATSDTTAAVHAHTWNNFTTATVSYPVTLIATNQYGCSSTTSKQVEVYPAVVASFTMDTVGCSPFPADIVNTSSGASSYFWDLGDGSGSVQPSPAHFYLNAGLSDVIYTATLVSTSVFGCSDTTSMDVLVHPSPIVQFTPSMLAGCQPLQVDFQDLTLGAVGMDWQFGDGAFTNGGPGDVTHTYAHTDTVPATYTVQLIGTTAFGCTDTATAPIQVYPQVVAAFTAPAEGCTPLTIAPVNTSTGAGTYLWDMGDGVTLLGPAPTHTYINGTSVNLSRTITLIATSAYGCADTLQWTVVVHPAPSAAFTATPFIQQFPASTVTLVNNTGPGAWSHAWEFGDGASSPATTAGIARLWHLGPVHHHAGGNGQCVQRYRHANGGDNAAFAHGLFHRFW